jgi:hypothetical protein
MNTEQLIRGPPFPISLGKLKSEELLTVMPVKLNTVSTSREGRNAATIVARTLPFYVNACSEREGIYMSAVHPPNSEILTEVYEVDQFIEHRLYQINEDVEFGKASLYDLLQVVTPYCTNLYAVAHRIVDRYSARLILQLAGFLVSLVERHTQAQHKPQGYGLKQLSNIEGLLLRMSIIGDHPPRDTHRTYWTWNANARLKFTSDPGEYWFNVVVNRTDELQQQIAQALRPICEGIVNIGNPSCAVAIGAAADATREIYKHYQMLWEPDAEGKRRMEPMYFMTRYRTCLPTYPVAGRIWGGVNAANMASQMQVDFLIGTIEPFYREVVDNRLPYLTSEDRLALQRDLCLPSVADRLLTTLNLSADDVFQLSEADIAAQIINAPLDVRATISAFADLHHEVARLTAFHWSLIQNYLVKPAKRLTNEQRRAMAVDPEHGTGGMTHNGTLKIMRMRKDHPVITRLCTALRLVSKRQ